MSVLQLQACATWQMCESRSAQIKPACDISLPLHPRFVRKLGCFVWTSMAFRLPFFKTRDLSSDVATNPMELSKGKLTVWEVTNSHNKKYFRHHGEQWFPPPMLGQSVWICIMFTACLPTPSSTGSWGNGAKHHRNSVIFIVSNHNHRIFCSATTPTVPFTSDTSYIFFFVSQIGSKYLIKPQPGFLKPVFFHFMI